MKSNLGNLWEKQFMAFCSLKSFLEYASDEEAQIAYYKRLGMTHVDLTTNEEYRIETPQCVIDEWVEDNKSAFNIIMNQIIVFLFTRYEFIIQDVVECVICDNPEKILKLIKVYPEYESAIGFSLKEFIRFESKEKYVRIISERLAKRILNGKPSDVFGRLRCILDVRNISTNVLDELTTKRNKIVHEGETYEISIGELEKYYMELDNLLQALASTLKNANIDVWHKSGIFQNDLGRLETKGES